MPRRVRWAALLCVLPSLAATPVTAPTVQRDHGGIVRGDVSRKTLSLVFTGGDYADGVSTILRVCRERKVPVTFFVTGTFLRLHADAARAIVGAGQKLGPHSDAHLLYCDWTDRSRSLVSEDTFKADLRKNLADLAAVSGANGSSWFLPPFEWFNDDQTREAADVGLTLINFTPGSGSNRDYVPESDSTFVPSTQISRDILSYERTDPHGLNGFILLLHAGSLRRDKMTDQLDALVAEIQRRGYEFVDLGTLLGSPRSP